MNFWVWGYGNIGMLGYGKSSIPRMNSGICDYHHIIVNIGNPNRTSIVNQYGIGGLQLWMLVL